MSSLARLLAFSLLLLVALIAASLTAQLWIRQQEQRILQNAGTALAGQVEAAVTLTGGADAPWSEARRAAVAAVTGARVEIVSAASVTEAAGQATKPLADGRTLVASHPAPTSDRIQRLFQRVTLALGVFAVMLVVALAVALGFKPLRDRETRSPFQTGERDLRSLSFLARTSVRQQAELDQERDERLRAEAEARHRLQLLNRALEEKIRLGRDLHDGVIQSLYAAGLTLQAARQLTASDPTAAGERLEASLRLINRTITDIRDHINGLSSASVRSDSLAKGLGDIVEELRAGRPVDLDLQVDERAAASLSDDQTSETMQITREAVSNALRHGGAGRLQIRLGPAPEGAAFLIRDDGTGFEPAAVRGGGHGLANMSARTKRAGGLWQLTSTPGGGTSVHVTWTTALSP